MFAYVSDAFGEWLTGVMYIEYDGTHAHIDNWLMSCLFSVNYRTPCSNTLYRNSLTLGCKPLEPRLHYPKNVKFQHIWSELGFTKKSSKTEKVKFRLDANIEETVGSVTHFVSLIMRDDILGKINDIFRLISMMTTLN